MKRPARAYPTRAQRRRKEILLRAGVWVFIVLFAFSIVGGLLAVSFIH